MRLALIAARVVVGRNPEVSRARTSNTPAMMALGCTEVSSLSLASGGRERPSRRLDYSHLRRTLNLNGQLDGALFMAWTVLMFEATCSRFETTWHTWIEINVTSVCSEIFRRHRGLILSSTSYTHPE